jgi:hypothetical protein
MLLWDQLRLCYCSIKPNEKQQFLHGNAVVGSITSLLLQHQTYNEIQWFLHGNAVVGLIISLFLQHST